MAQNLNLLCRKKPASTNRTDAGSPRHRLSSGVIGCQAYTFFSVAFFFEALRKLTATTKTTKAIATQFAILE